MSLIRVTPVRDVLNVFASFATQCRICCQKTSLRYCEVYKSYSHLICNWPLFDRKAWKSGVIADTHIITLQDMHYSELCLCCDCGGTSFQRQYQSAVKKSFQSCFGECFITWFGLFQRLPHIQTHNTSFVLIAVPNVCQRLQHSLAQLTNGDQPYQSISALISHQCLWETDWQCTQNCLHFNLYDNITNNAIILRK